jgi:steroid delta-isomerase-like uncharacterized protein
MDIAAQSAQTEQWARNFMKVIDSKDPAAAGPLISDDVEYHDCRYAPIIGKAALTVWGAGLWSGMPDLKRLEIVNMAVTGRVAFIECHYEGTHVGEYLGFPATGNTIRYSAVLIYTFNDEGQLIRQMFYNDVEALESQLRGEVKN